jgi:adenosylcobinamide-GDP ribazoletransferase
MTGDKRPPLTDIVCALMLLTRLPVARLAAFGGQPDMARCVWAFPLAGLLVNGIGALVWWVGFRCGLPPMLIAAWTLAATMMVTGALHEDGLADTADGLGGGRTPAAKLDIMRDSRIGTYGALALLMSVIVRVGALTAAGRPDHAIPAFIAAGVLGRAGMLVLLLTLVPARGDGLGASMGTARPGRAWLGLGLATVLAFLCFSPGLAVAAMATGFGASLLLARLARSQIGGFTGDLLGAAEIVTESVVLTVAAGWLG